VRHPRPAHLARSRARRWSLRVVLVLLALASALGCQAALSSPPAAAYVTPVALSACQGDLGHDLLCARGVAPIAAPTARGERDGVLPLLVTLVIGVAAGYAAVGAGLLARFRTVAGPPPWASQQLVPGRHQLVALGISRI
jgi:hypothetical protein